MQNIKGVVDLRREIVDVTHLQRATQVDARRRIGIAPRQNLVVGRARHGAADIHVNGACVAKETGVAAIKTQRANGSGTAHINDAVVGDMTGID